MNIGPINIDPTLVRLGPLEVRWYGLMYVLGFLLAGVIQKRLSRQGFFKVSVEKVDVFLTYMLVGMFLGARVFYVFIYNWGYYSQNLSEIFSVWRGGLSFHGALAGMSTALFFFARKYKLHYFQVADVLALSGTQGLFWGRIGNFINGELYGRPTDLPWGIVFPDAGPLPRHPSQLYEGTFEGIILFVLLWIVKPRVKIYGPISGLFIMGYAFFRFFVEFFREPDVQLGYYFGGTLTMGQILCILMFMCGVAYFYMAKKKNISIC